MDLNELESFTSFVSKVDPKALGTTEVVTEVCGAAVTDVTG